MATSDGAESDESEWTGLSEGEVIELLEKGWIQLD